MALVRNDNEPNFRQDWPKCENLAFCLCWGDTEIGDGVSVGSWLMPITV